MAVIVSTDKDTYGKTSFAKISVRVKNTGDRVLKRVHADWVISDNASLVSKNSMVFDAEALSPGELLESDIEICLSPDRANINLFHKFILKIKLFFRAITGSQAPDGAPPENEQSLTLEDTSKEHSVRRRNGQAVRPNGPFKRHYADKNRRYIRHGKPV